MRGCLSKADQQALKLALPTHMMFRLLAHSPPAGVCSPTCSLKHPQKLRRGSSEQARVQVKLSLPGEQEPLALEESSLTNLTVLSGPAAGLVAKEPKCVLGAL
jgi:hypothetical protein